MSSSDETWRISGVEHRSRMSCAILSSDRTRAPCYSRGTNTIQVLGLQWRLPQGGPSFEPLVGALDSRLRKSPPNQTKPNQTGVGLAVALEGISPQGRTLESDGQGWNAAAENNACSCIRNAALTLAFHNVAALVDMALHSSPTFHSKSVTN